MDFLHIAIVIAIILVSVILHELSHGVVAYALGDKTAKEAGRLTLNPIKHIDPFMSILVPVVLYMLNAPVFGGAKPVPVDSENLKWREYGMALVALAGPATNFLLSLLVFLIGHFSGLLYDGDIIGFIFAEMVLINIGFAVFNLIPIPPLDGSRVLYALSPDFFRNILASIEPYGFIIVYLLIFLFGNTFSAITSSAMQGVLDFFYLLVGK